MLPIGAAEEFGLDDEAGPADDGPAGVDGPAELGPADEAGYEVGTDPVFVCEGTAEGP